MFRLAPKAPDPFVDVPHPALHVNSIEEAKSGIFTQYVP
jgi:hypothetical protein